MASVTLCTLLHGAGSTPEFVSRCFGLVVREHGATLIAPDVRGMSVAQMVDVLAESDSDVVGGVSLGAHAAATFAAESGYTGGLLLVMPAWCGPPGPIAALTAHTADEIEATSAATVLARLARFAGDDWVFAELQRAWTSTDDAELASILRVAAAQPAPQTADLRRIRALTEVVVLEDDPTHPALVGRTWAASIQGAHLTALPRDLAGAGCSALAGPLAGLLAALSASR